MARRSTFRLERLEDRAVPALFGTPWIDGGHLTLSFVRDGTPVDGVGSSLSQTLPGPEAVWQGEVLRAVQTWAAQANLNVAVVGEVGGVPLGASGATQGDG